MTVAVLLLLAMFFVEQQKQLVELVLLMGLKHLQMVFAELVKFPDFPGELNLYQSWVSRAMSLLKKQEWAFFFLFLFVIGQCLFNGSVCNG